MRLRVSAQRCTLLLSRDGDHVGALNKGGDRLGALKLRAISAQGFGGGYLGLRGRAYLRAPRAEFLKIARPPKTALPRHVFKLQKSQSGAWRGGGAFGSLGALKLAPLTLAVCTDPRSRVWG